MTELKPSLLHRLSIAFSTFFGVLADPGFALQVERLRKGDIGAGAPRPAPPEPKPTSPLQAAAPDAAFQLLGLLQRDGRFIDFIEENIGNYSDAEVGAAARLVHEGCRKVVHEHFSLAPVRDEAEGSRITLEAGFDASAIRLTGNVVGKPPFRGSISHRGWRIIETRLPKLAASHDAAIVAPAEVEL